jgi:putative SOS response-associated peptidase YedK
LRHSLKWDKAKQKYRFTIPGTGALYMAGRYRTFEGKQRCVILPTAANAPVAEVYSRMPVVLSADEIHSWLYDESRERTIL